MRISAKKKLKVVAVWQAIQEEHSTAAEEGVPEKEMVSSVSDEHEDMLAVDDRSPMSPLKYRNTLNLRFA